MTAEISVPDYIPTVRIIETTAAEHTMMGTHDEVVNKMVAQGWEVSEELPGETVIVHPLITGTARHLFK